MVLNAYNNNNTNAASVRRDASHPESATYEEALHMAGYGRMSLAVLGACALAFLATGFQNACMSFVLPAARCDLDLTTYRAGIVNMAFMCGGVTSAFIWGIVGDVYGRKKVLIATLLLDAVVTLAQSTVHDYSFLIAARSMNGFLIGGPSTLVFSYLSDLVGTERRQKYLNITGFCFVAAWLILPGLAWQVIPFKLTEYNSSLAPIHSWRLYLALMSVPGIISGFWFFFLPESPRFLMNSGRSDDALEILRKLYSSNFSKGQFSVKQLIADDISSGKLTNEGNKATEMLSVVLNDLKLFISKAYAFKSTLILFVFFANMAAGFGLSLWVPELLVRMKNNNSCAVKNVNDVPGNWKILPNSSWNTETNISKEYSTTYDGYRNSELANLFIRNHSGHRSFDLGEEFVNSKDICKDEIDSEIFLNSLEVGLVAVISNIACLGIISRYGATGVRNAAALCTVVCSCACICLTLTACGAILSSWSNALGVTGAVLLTATSLNGNILLMRLMLHALPSRLSGLGVCWGAWWGRLGGVAVNLAVGALLDISCHAPFGIVAAILAEFLRERRWLDGKSSGRRDSGLKRRNADDSQEIPNHIENIAIQRSRQLQSNKSESDVAERDSRRTWYKTR